MAEDKPSDANPQKPQRGRTRDAYARRLKRMREHGLKPPISPHGTNPQNAPHKLLVGLRMGPFDFWPDLQRGRSAARHSAR